MKSCAWLLAALLGASLHARAAELEPEPAYLQIELGEHAGPVRRIAADPRRDLVVTGADDKTARTWSLVSGRPRRVFRPPVGENEVGRVYGVALHPTRPWLAVGGTTGRAAAHHTIHLFDADTGQPVRAIDARGGDVKRLFWSADGTLLVAGYAGVNAVRVFDPEGRLVLEERFDAAVYALATSSQGLLAAIAFDGTLRIYEAAAGRVVRRASQRAPARNVASAAFSPDGRFLVLGYFAQGKAPDIVDWESGAAHALPAPSRMRSENLMSVAWSAHGAQIVAAGSYGFAQRKVMRVEYDPSRRSIVRESPIARSSIADLATLGDGRTAYAATDGSWGVAGDDAIRTSRLPDLTGAANLRVDPNGRKLSWTLDGGSNRVMFDIARREVSFGQGADLPRASSRRGLFDAATDWADLPSPQVNGARIPLQPDEVSRAVAVFASGTDAVLGTSRALYRIGTGGRVVWRVATGTEVRAVNVTRDDRVIVTAMLDGTVRLWRSTDGQAVLALLVLHDGKWVMWTPDGYFDAGVGADMLIGWVVNRPADGAAEYHPLARLRERFHQPALFDHLLESLDPAQAARSHRDAIAREAAASDAHASVVAAPAAPMIGQLPPLLHSSAPAVLQSDGTVVKVPFAVSSQTPVTQLAFEARVDARPARLMEIALPAHADGRSMGWLTVELPPAGASLQLLARDAKGYSEPLLLQLERPAAKADAVALPVATPPSVQLPARIVTRPRLFLLAVGVSEYARADYRLGLAAKDAQDFAAAMEGQRGKFYGEVFTRVLVDEHARRDAVLDGLHWLSVSAGRRDVAILFIAGHGLSTTSGQYFFLPYDGRDEDLAGTAVAEDSIRDALRTVAGRALLFVDTCFAGKAIGTLKDRNRELSRFVNDLASAENGVIVFAASAGRQLSEESDAWGNGAFTRALIQGLKGSADLLKSGRITYKGLDYFVSEEVKRLTKGRQTPVSLSPWGVPDFPLAGM